MITYVDMFGPGMSDRVSCNDNGTPISTAHLVRSQLSFPPHQVNDTPLKPCCSQPFGLLIQLLTSCIWYMGICDAKNTQMSLTHIWFPPVPYGVIGSFKALVRVWYTNHPRPPLVPCTTSQDTIEAYWPVETALWAFCLNCACTAALESLANVYKPSTCPQRWYISRQMHESW
jgi:hypothetical protein